ncbi:stage II sporulation protein M [Endozoicomonas sp. G2_1]|uniref:stage II sporulation protein M n=1 Tax=Endozoicomonas sp. G2_1 TaxID=2821091 RepID=UPI001ADD1043|nr:stage II sporulation protein M [Endozoicomonas sp. G2_1]MBO9489460.1 stage II sporulation protein M [Endozoicomonas sp. G2_1]
MKQSLYVQKNRERWQTFEQLCQQAELLDTNFPKLYRQQCADLALARTRQYSPALINKLNELVRVGQEKLYQGETVSIRTIWQSFRQDFPKALFICRYYIWAAMLAFWGLGLVAYIVVLFDPDAIYYFLDPSNVKDIEYMYDPSGSVQTDKRMVDSDVLMFGVYIYNNIGIAFQMFGAGALFGVGALIPLLFNSFYFGAISAHIVNIGFSEPFFSFVITHGSFELTAIIIAGAAGCKIGFTLLNPGQYARAYAVKKASKKVLPLIVGAFVMLVIAAVIEAFWSPLAIPAQIKYVSGSLCWAWVIYKLYQGTRYGA